jgi:hypothetical protein
MDVSKAQPYDAGGEADEPAAWTHRRFLRCGEDGSTPITIARSLTPYLGFRLHRVHLDSVSLSAPDLQRSTVAHGDPESQLSCVAFHPRLVALGRSTNSILVLRGCDRCLYPPPASHRKQRCAGILGLVVPSPRALPSAAIWISVQRCLTSLFPANGCTRRLPSR